MAIRFVLPGDQTVDIVKDLRRVVQSRGLKISALYVIEGHLMMDHVHMCIAIPLKHSVASVIGFIKGKSAVSIARMQGKERDFARMQGKVRDFAGEQFWAHGYAVSTVEKRFAATFATRTALMETVASENALGITSLWCQGLIHQGDRL